MPIRLAILSTHPIQYQAPVWRTLAADPEIDIHVFFGSDFSVRRYYDKGFGGAVTWDIPLTDGYNHTFLSNEVFENKTRKISLPMTDFAHRMKAFKPDAALLTAYTPLSFYGEAALVLRLLGIPIVLRTEASDEALIRNPVKEIIRTVSLRMFYRQVRRCLAIGEDAKRHFTAKGVPPARIGWSPYCVDTIFLEDQIQRYLPRREEIRKELGFFEDRVVFIYSGKLTPVKDPLIIAAALRQVAASLPDPIGLIVMGDGILKERFEQEMQAQPAVVTRFVGFQNQRHIGKFYAAADCLVLPSISGETWGLVVNEALQFGRLVIVSNRVGCHHDLVRQGETGFVFPPGDAAALAQAMCKAIELIKKGVAQTVQACRQQVATYTVERAVEGIRQAIINI